MDTQKAEKKVRRNLVDRVLRRQKKPGNSLHSTIDPETPSANMSSTSEAGYGRVRAGSPSGGHLSCCNLALKRLKTDDPVIYKRLTSEWTNSDDVTSGSSSVSALDFESLLSDAKCQNRRRSRAWNSYERSIIIALEYKELVLAAALLDPTRVAPTVLKGVFTLLQQPLTEFALHEKMLRDIEDVLFILRRWTNIEARITPDKTFNFSLFNPTDVFKDLKECLVSFYVALLQWSVDGLENMGRHRAVKVLEVAALRQQWDRLTEAVKSKDKSCDAVLKLVSEKLETRVEVLRWIYPQDPLNDHDMNLKRTRVGTIYRGAGQWFIDCAEFQQWSREEETVERAGAVMWLQGTVGTGKTTLVTRTIEYHIQNSARFRNRRLSFFYCSRNVATKTEDVIQAILRQVATDQFRTEIFSDVRDCHQAYKDSGRDGRPSHDTCLDLLEAILAAGLRLRLIIDALDECENWEDLLDGLSRLQSSSGGMNLELLLASRHEVDVNNYFPSCIIINLNSPMPSTEMERFLTMEVNQENHSHRITRSMNEDLKAELIEALMQRTGGMFRYAQLQLSLFLDRKSKLIHPSDIKAKIRQVRHQDVSQGDVLKQAYDEIYDRNVGRQDLAPVRMKHAERAYSILLCCSYPVSLDMLVDAIAIDTETGEWDRAVDNEYILGLGRDIFTPTSPPTVSSVPYSGD